MFSGETNTQTGRPCPLVWPRAGWALGHESKRGAASPRGAPGSQACVLTQLCSSHPVVPLLASERCSWFRSSELGHGAGVAPPVQGVAATLGGGDRCLSRGRQRWRTRDSAERDAGFSEKEVLRKRGSQKRGACGEKQCQRREEVRRWWGWRHRGKVTPHGGPQGLSRLPRRASSLCRLLSVPKQLIWSVCLPSICLSACLSTYLPTYLPPYLPISLKYQGEKWKRIIIGKSQRRRIFELNRLLSRWINSWIEVFLRSIDSLSEKVCDCVCDCVVVYDCVWLCMIVCVWLCVWLCVHVDLSPLLSLMPWLVHPASPGWPAGECLVSPLVSDLGLGSAPQVAPVRTLQPWQGSLPYFRSLCCVHAGAHTGVHICMCSQRAFGAEVLTGPPPPGCQPSVKGHHTRRAVLLGDFPDSEGGCADHSGSRQLVHHNLCVSGECVCVCLVTQLCPALCDPMDCTPPGSSVQRILQARILQWVAIPFSRGSSRPRDWTQDSCLAGGCFTIWVTREAK